MTKFLAAALLLLSLGTGAPLFAAEVSYPRAKPQFTIEVPEGWKATFRAETLLLMPNADGSYQVQIEATREPAPERARRRAAEVKLTDFELGTPAEAENQHKVTQTVLTSRGQRGDAAYALTLVAFSVGDGRYVAEAAGPADANRKHNVALLTMMDSIKPVAAGN